MASSQLSLHIPTYVKYSPQDFYLHSGVRSLYEAVVSLVLEKSAQSFFITGKARSGKSHLCFALADALSGKGLIPRVLSGNDLAVWLDELPLTHRSLEQEMVLIDDVDVYLKQRSEGQSGQFVSLMEFCKARKIPVLLFSSAELSDFPCDAHIMSRLRAAAHYRIESPAESELSEIFQILAKQRGLQLSERKRDFLRKRLGRDIESLEQYIERLLYLSDVLGKSAKFDLLHDAL